MTQLPDVEAFPYKAYSGYLNASDTKHLHYTFIQSQDKPTTDPLVIWFNGGPGCSSLLAFFQEHGPYVIDDGESFIHKNDQPWNLRANVAYFESPAGVGYSVADTPQDLQTNDMIQSQDALSALKHFFLKFPEYLTNDLYIAGESYGGIYVPYLSWQIYQNNLQAKFNTNLTTYNLKGLLVGNGATKWDYDVSPSFPQTVYNFHLITKELYDTFENNDCHYYFNDVRVYNNSQLCIDAWNNITTLTSNLNWYDLYRPVYGSGLLKAEHNLETTYVNGEAKTYKKGMTMGEYTPWLKHTIANKHLKVSGDFLTTYVNRADVRKAMNIPDSVQAW